MSARPEASHGALGAVYDRAPTAEEIHWQLKGACRDQDPNLWTPNPPHVEYKSQVAKNICLTQCPVLAECKAHALEHREAFGVWGGMTEAERDLFWNGRRRRRHENSKFAEFYVVSA